MTQQIVTKIKPYTFRIYWEGIRNSELILNWKPIIDQFGLTGNFLLVHWQARPKFYRRWGAYCSEKDEYFSGEYDEIIFDGAFEIRLLQISERKYSTTPVAPVFIKAATIDYFPNQKLYKVITV